MIGSENTGIFETLFRSASEGIIVVNSKGNIIMVNPAARKMFGYKDSMENMSIEDLLPDHLKETHRKHREKYHIKPQTRSMGSNLELLGKRGNGTTFPVEVSLSPTQIQNQQVVMAFVVDITERQNRENVVLSMGRIFENSFNEIFTFDSLSLKFIRVNKAAATNLGYSKEELRNMTPCDIKPELPREKFEALIAPLRDGTPKIHFETLHRRKDGTHYPVEVHLQLSEFGQHKTFMAIVMDISERKFAEDQLRQYYQQLEKSVQERTLELRESQKLYQTIARNFPDGMINVFDRELRYVFVEGKELYALGITSDMLIGTRYVDRLVPEIAAHAERELSEVFKGHGKTIEIRHKQNDYILEAVPLADDQGTVNQILVIEKNITQQKKVQDKIQRTLERERELNEMKSRFVSMASHEFRTPLSTILSSASLLSRYQGSQDESKREKHIQRIKTSVHNLTGILNDFLSLDKLETGAVESHPVRFDLMAFVREVCDQVGPTLKKNQRIVYNHLGPNEAFLDKQLINNVLINLLSNASKYSDDGQAIDLTTQAKDHQIVIQIRDRGIGISEEDQNHLFERFFRAKNVMNIQGTGLGLNIVKKYVDLMNGDIAFKSEIGKGSTFTVKLRQTQEA